MWLDWERFASMRWAGLGDSGEFLIYRKAMRKGSRLDIPIAGIWVGGVAFRRDASAEEDASSKPRPGSDGTSEEGAGKRSSDGISVDPSSFSAPMSPRDNGAQLSDNMGGTYTYTPRLLRDGVQAFQTGHAAFQSVPDELENATVFSGSRDQAWTGKLTVRAHYAGYAYVWATPGKDGGITRMMWEQIGTMRWEGLRREDSGEFVIYRKAMKSNSWLDINIADRWLGGVAFRRDESAEDKATNLQLDYIKFGCRQSLKIIDAVVKEDALSMTVERCFLFCAEHSKSGYFGIEGGNKCWCAHTFYGDRLESSRCDVPCSGNPRQRCGGYGNAASVYQMFSCNHGGAATEGKLVRSEYTVTEQQTCGALGGGGGGAIGPPPGRPGGPPPGGGQTIIMASTRKSLRGARTIPHLQLPENRQSLQLVDRSSIGPNKNYEEPGGARVLIDGEYTLVGSVQACMKACDSGDGNMECAGFTYDSNYMKCTFVADPTAGWAQQEDWYSCYTKGYLSDLAALP